MASKEITKPPKKILFVSDDTEAEFVFVPPSRMPKTDVPQFMYRYTKVGEKSNNLGKEFPVSLDHLNKLLSVNYLKIIEP